MFTPSWFTTKKVFPAANFAYRREDFFLLFESKFKFDDKSEKKSFNGLQSEKRSLKKAPRHTAFDENRSKFGGNPIGEEFQEEFQDQKLLKITRELIEFDEEVHQAKKRNLLKLLKY